MRRTPHLWEITIRCFDFQNVTKTENFSSFNDDKEINNGDNEINNDEDDNRKLHVSKYPEVDSNTLMSTLYVEFKKQIHCGKSR